MLTLTRIAFSYYVLVLCFMIAILAHSPQKDFLRYPNGFPRCSKQLSPMFKCLQICSKHALRQSLSQFYEYFRIVMQRFVEQTNG